MSYSFGPVIVSAEARALQAEVRQFLADEAAAGTFEPGCDSWLGGNSPEFSRKLAARGWLGMTFPKQYGGQGRSAIERFLLVGELLAAGAPVAAHWIADRQSGPLLLKYGTEAQRQRFLPSIARGECFFAIGMSEPDSGSDLSSVKTRAVKVDGGWQVNGSKVWTSHAHRSHFAISLIRTSIEEADRDKSLTQFIVDLHAPGVEIKPIRILTGEAHFCEIIFNDVFLPDDMVVGTAGGGWKQVLSELAYERSGPERFMSTYPLFVEFVRYAGAAPNVEDAALIGRMTAHLTALYRLSLSVAGAIDAGLSPVTEASMVKELGTRLERDVAEAIRQRVEMADAPAALRARYAEAVLHSPGFSLRGGTNEILRGIISRGLAA